MISPRQELRTFQAYTHTVVLTVSRGFKQPLGKHAKVKSILEIWLSISILTHIICLRAVDQALSVSSQHPLNPLSYMLFHERTWTPLRKPRATRENLHVCMHASSLFPYQLHNPKRTTSTWRLRDDVIVRSPSARKMLSHRHWGHGSCRTHTYMCKHLVNLKAATTRVTSLLCGTWDAARCRPKIATRKVVTNQCPSYILSGPCKHHECD